MRIAQIRLSLVLRLGLIALIIASLSACGFKLRGAFTFPEALKNIYLQGASTGQLKRELKEILAYSANVVDKRSDADAILNIDKAELEKRTLSVDSRGKIREAELQLSVLFSVTTSDGVVLLDKEPLMLERDYIDDEDDVIGRSNEAQIITRDLERDAAQRIARRIQALKPELNAQ